MNHYPTICIVGPKGNGKTVLMTEIADSYQKLGYTIFANYHLIGIPYTYIEFSDIVDFPEYLHDGIILIDEAHIGTDAYDFFSKRVREITKFSTQTRKRKLIFIYTTQVFSQVAKRLRDQTEYLYFPRPTKQEGIFYIELHNRGIESFIKAEFKDLRPYFSKYDTNEIIQL